MVVCAELRCAESSRAESPCAESTPNLGPSWVTVNNDLLVEAVTLEESEEDMVITV